MTSKDPSQVGYGKPPVGNQFPPGQSGNPRGRPKGAKGVKAELEAEFNEFVTITEDGKTKRVRKGRVIIKALVAKAAKGHVGAADKVLTLMIQMFGYEDQRAATRALSDTEQLILDRMLSGDASVAGIVTGPGGAEEASSSGVEQPRDRDDARFDSDGAENDDIDEDDD